MAGLLSKASVILRAVSVISAGVALPGGATYVAPKSGKRIARFKPTRMVYTIRSGAHGPRLIRRIGSLPFILVLGGLLALGVGGATACLQEQTVVTGNTITVSRGRGHDAKNDETSGNNANSVAPAATGTY